MSADSEFWSCPEAALPHSHRTGPRGSRLTAQRIADRIRYAIADIPNVELKQNGSMLTLR